MMKAHRLHSLVLALMLPALANGFSLSLTSWPSFNFDFFKKSSPLHPSALSSTVAAEAAPALKDISDDGVVGGGDTSTVAAAEAAPAVINILDDADAVARGGEAVPALIDISDDADAVAVGGDTLKQFWKWRGHDIFTEVRTSSSTSVNEKKKPTVILLHGFGASTTYWRETMSVLQSEGYDVHALDLLGQGRSSKPYSTEDEEVDGSSSSSGVFYRLYPNNDESTSSSRNIDDNSDIEMGKNTDTKVQYSINMWANMVDDYARHHKLEEVVLMGNSLGSLVALSAATGDFIETNNSLDRENLFAYLAGNNLGERSKVKGVCLFNCAVGLNSRNVIKNPSFGPVQRAVFNWLFDVLNSLIFDNAALLRFALNNVVTKELLEDALKSLYTVSPERVDKELVDSFYYPAKLGGEGAVEAIRQIYCNDAGLTPLEYHKKYPEILDKMPLHLIWGLEDVVTPITGDVGMFYCDRVANNRGGKGMTTIDCVKGGHLLFDDNHVDTHDAMMKWLNRRIMK